MLEAWAHAVWVSLAGMAGTAFASAGMPRWERWDVGAHGLSDAAARDTASSKVLKVGSCGRHTNDFRLVRSKAWTSQAVRTGKQAATVPTRAQLNHTFVTPGAIRQETQVDWAMAKHKWQNRA